MVYLKHMVNSYENYFVRQINPIDEMINNDYGNGPSYAYDEPKNCGQNILRREFDSQSIWIYPEEIEENKNSNSEKSESKKRNVQNNHESKIFMKKTPFS